MILNKFFLPSLSRDGIGYLVMYLIKRNFSLNCFPFLLEEKKDLERLCNASKQVDCPVFNVLSDVESPVAGIIAAIDKLSTKISEIVEKSYNTQNYNFSQDGGF